MIITKLIGGLGNQMFQYAVARALSHRHGTPFKLDISAYKGDPKRVYRLNNLNIVGNIATAEDLKETYPDRNNLFKWILHHGKQRLFPYYLKPYVKERRLSYDPLVIKVKRNVYLDGYWQSDKYFADCADIIHQDFTLKDKPKANIAKLANYVKSNNSVSLHVRRGDYVIEPKTNLFHGVLPIKYYEKALFVISKHVKDPLVYVFSDDIQWVKDNLKTSLPIEFSDQDNEDYEDLYLMSNCKHQIIANSSFSWWGAWLSNHDDKIVLAPKKWFAHLDADIDSRFPEDWILL